MRTDPTPSAPSNPAADQEALIRALQAERDELRTQLTELQSEMDRARERRRWLAGKGVHFAWLLVAGSDLTTAIEHWITSVKTSHEVPSRETAEVLAATFRRLVRVGLFTLILSLLPSILSAAQTYFMREQIAVMQNQDTATRRAQLIAAIYDEDCSLPRIPEPDGGESCPPRASARARTEAVKAFIALERSTGAKKVDLSQARLMGLQFRNVDFRDINLQYADLRHASFFDSDLRDVSLGGADLSGVAIYDSDLSGARLTGAYTRRAGTSTHRGTLLLGTRFDNCRLSGADMNDAQYDPTTQWKRITYSSSTRWPEGLALQSHSTNSFRLEEPDAASSWSPYPP